MSTEIETSDNLKKKSQEPDIKNFFLFFLLTPVVCFIVFSISQMGQLIGLLIGAQKDPEFSFLAFFQSIAENPEILYNGDLLALASIFGGITGIIVCYFADRIARVQDLFPLKLPNIKELVIFIVLTFLVMFFMGYVDEKTGWFEVPFMEQVLSSISNMPLFVLGVGVLIPIFEELLFRGIMFKGFERAFQSITNSALSGHLAVFLSSIFFCFAHAGQYSVLICLLLMPLALILGYSRLYTKSLFIPILIHILNNSMTAIFGSGA